MLFAAARPPLGGWLFARAAPVLRSVRTKVSNGTPSKRRGEVQRRVGMLGVKVGMIGTWDMHGKRHAITVVHVDGCRVVQVKKKDVTNDGYTALQVGSGTRKEKHVHKPQRGHMARWEGLWDAEGAETPHKLLRKLTEFRVSDDALLPPGTRISSAHFKPGQLVDVQGVSKGKGFAGVMKRWGFAGQPASHGVSRAHRALGSTGACQTPGRVPKGKKMPGRMGGENKTVQNLVVHRVDTVRDLVFIRGAIAGPKGGFVKITDAIKKIGPDEYAQGVVPFPTIAETANLPQFLEYDDEPPHEYDKGGMMG